RVARVLSAWAVTTKASTAILTALWGVLGGLLGPRTAIGLAGVLLLATPLLLPRRPPAESASSMPRPPACARAPRG
ncbi:MFS transporter, partial [Nonomuraea sp. B19D2]